MAAILSWPQCVNPLHSDTHWIYQHFLIISQSWDCAGIWNYFSQKIKTVYPTWSVYHSAQLMTRARFLSPARSKLRLCSANHRAGYFSYLACDHWWSIVWAYSKQGAENGPWWHYNEPWHWEPWYWPSFSRLFKSRITRIDELQSLL